MQLIGFIHGIGNFQPTDLDKVKTLEHMQLEADKVYGAGNSKVFYLSYEDILDKLVASKFATILAASASSLYVGTPILGRILADYGDDIFEYYLSEKLRERVCKQVLQQLTDQTHQQGIISGITLIGHSLGSLVLLRCMAMIQSISHGISSTTISPRLLDEILFDPATMDNLNRLAAYTIQPVLFGSPSMSRVPAFKSATRNMALAESRADTVLNGQVALGKPLFINCYSDNFFHDPLSGPVENKLPAINVRGGWTHSNIEPEFTALMNYFAGVKANMLDQAG